MVLKAIYKLYIIMVILKYFFFLSLYRLVIKQRLDCRYARDVCMFVSLMGCAKIKIPP